MSRLYWLLAALGGAAVLYSLSRTQRGQAAASAAVETTLDFVDVTASRIGSALSSRGYRNNNPGNLRYIAKNPWRGQVGTDGAFGIYESPQDGTRALGKQLQAYERRGLRTVRDIIATWAPSVENDTGSYVKDIARQLNVGADESFAVSEQLPQLARAIAKHENGYVDASYDWNWVYLS